MGLCKSLIAMFEGDNPTLTDMEQILDLGYIHLPSHLKTCLLSIGKYREDQEIEKDELLRQWIAEGFVVSTTHGLDAEDVAEDYFNELINMSMIQALKIDYNNEVLSCRVHDIMLDLIRSKAAEENFIHVVDGLKCVTEAHGEIRRVSVHYNETIKRSLSHVRSVSLYRRSRVPCFWQYKYIRVLHIEHRSSSLDLTCISTLFLLRYLKVACSPKFSHELKLPSQIGELQQLETIDLDGAILERYPSNIVSLPRLLHLIYGGGYGIALPDGIDRLKSLHTLEGVDVFKSSIENIKGLSKLSKLRKLHVFWNGSSQSVGETTMDALYSFIWKLSANLRTFTSKGSLVYIPDVPGWITRTPFPWGSHIRELDLCCCRFQRCPEWIGQLHGLCKICIRVREVADGMSIVAWLPLLAYFDLCVCVMGEEEEKEESVVIPGICSGAFRALKHLWFLCPMASLTFEAGAMPKLEKLDILFRYDMAPQFLPVGIQHLPVPTLKEIRLNVAHDQHYLSSASASASDKSRKHTAKLGPMLKRAFKQQHPGADIVFQIGVDEYIGDDEDDDSEGVDDEVIRQ